MLGRQGIGLRELNGLSERQAYHALFTVCASPVWARRMESHRPYATDDEILTAADRTLAGLSDAEIDNALEGHPRIGERSVHASSATEQAAVLASDSATLDALAAGNKEYEARFGHVYLVAAFGRSPEELLAVLESRLTNTPDIERATVRSELAKINRLRLQRIIESKGPE